MVAHRDDDDADRVFAALSDPTRRDIVDRVLQEEASVTTLARGYDMSFAAVQKHVATLERAGLVTKERRGREQIVRGRVDPIRAAAGVLDHYERLWRSRIRRVEQLLAEPPPPDHADKDSPCRSSAPPRTPTP